MSALAGRLAPVAARLGRLRGSIKRLFALDGLSRLVLALLGFAALTFLADWGLDLPLGVRVLFLLGGIGLAGWVLATRVLRPLGVRISDDDLAIFVERNFPELNDKLISAIQLTRETGSVGGAMFTNSPELVEALVSEAEQATASLDFKKVIVRGHVGRIFGWAAGIVGLIALASAASAAVRKYETIYLQRMVGIKASYPHRNHLTVLDFPNNRKVVARGDDLVVAVASDGPTDPSKVLLHYEFATSEQGDERMTPLAGRRFQFLFTRVTGPFRFRVDGGDHKGDEWYQVDLVTPPAVDAVRVFYEYPPYMRKQNTPSDRPEGAGNVVAPFHTKVRFEAQSNEDLRGATLLVGLKGKEKTTELEVKKDAQGRPRAFAGSFEIADLSSEYELRLQAENGLGNRDPIRFAVKGLKDEPPRITVQDPVGDEFITELCERPLELKVDDDYGVARIVLEYRVLSQQPEKTSRDWVGVEFTREQNSREYGEASIVSQHVFNVAKLKLAAGDHVELRFRAEDFKDIGGRNATTSKVYKLSVVSLGTLEKELQDAIEKIKILLRTQKSKQENAWSRTGRLITNFGKVDSLAPEQQGEVRQAGLDQNEITSKLDGARKDIRQIQRRGVYNKIYNETAAQKLQGAIDELDQLTGVPGDATKDGIARIAAARLDQSAKLKSGAERTEALRDAQGRQSQVATGIQRALEYLDKWSSYQEVIRMAREAKERIDTLNNALKKGK